MQPAASRASRIRFARRALAGSALFGAGYAVAAVVSFATGINGGLVQALDSVGKNLFGSAVFSTVALPPSPIFPNGAMQLDIAADSRLGASVGPHPWQGFGQQKRFAEDQARHDWILNLDADEWISEDLRFELASLLAGEPRPWVLTNPIYVR